MPFVPPSAALILGWISSSSATVKRSGSSPFWSCPTVSLPMAYLRRRLRPPGLRAVSTLFHGVGPSRSPSHPRRSGGHRRQDGTALPRPYPGQKGHSHGQRVGLVPWLGAGPDQGGRPRSPMKSPPSPSATAAGARRLHHHHRRHGSARGR